jgi:hypothetical protein
MDTAWARTLTWAWALDVDVVGDGDGDVAVGGAKIPYWTRDGWC